MPSVAQVSAILLAITSSALARPTIAKRQFSNSTISSAVVVTGAAEGGTQPRLEIHDLMQNADQWNIYLLAVQSFQAMDPSDPLSWYQIGGIHGHPFTEYNGVSQCQGCDLQGYCTHSSTLFPTWHRAHVALFEQSLQANAITIANHFTGHDQQRYLAAAQNLRTPHWDWGLRPRGGEDAFPQFFTDATVTVHTPTGQQTIPNPLLQYSFGSAEHSFAGDTTTRRVIISTSTREQARSDLWTLLTSQANYNEFSTRALNRRGDNPSSLEAIHDTIHTDIGGDMANVETAGFDPAFWLHHAFVDRVLTLYQAAWPQTWLESTDEVGDSFTYTSGSIEDSSSVLEPFSVSSDAIRDTSYFNYNFADLASGQSAADIINHLYGSQSPSSSLSAKRSSELQASNITHEYIARVELDLPGSEGSFDLFIFDGEPGATPDRWYKDADFLGQHGFFTDTKIKGNHDKISHASVSLTASLKRRVESGELKDMEPETVALHLRGKMQWRVVDRFDKEVPTSNIPMLQINVITAQVEMPAERGVMPKWHAFEQLVGCDSDIGAWISGWCPNV